MAAVLQLGSAAARRAVAALPPRASAVIPAFSGLRTAASSAAAKKSIMSVTPMAAERLQALMDKNEDDDGETIGVRIGLRQRGCNGLTYTMNYATDVKKFDEVIDVEGGPKVVIDSKAVMFLIGTEMDYVSNEIVSEFVFNNPNKKSECGCGQSFNV